MVYQLVLFEKCVHKVDYLLLLYCLIVVKRCELFNCLDSFLLTSNGIIYGDYFLIQWTLYQKRSLVLVLFCFGLGLIRRCSLMV